MLNDVCCNVRFYAIGDVISILLAKLVIFFYICKYFYVLQL